MFVRQKKNRSGSVSVQIIFKDKYALGARKYKVVKTIGCSTDPLEIKELVLEGKHYR